MPHIHKFLCCYSFFMAVLLLSGACSTKTRVSKNAPSAPAKDTQAQAAVPARTDYTALGGSGEAETVLVESPAPSSDGSLLAFASAAGPTKTLDIWVTDRTGENPRILTPWDTVERSADWSPDGLRIAFSTNRDADDFNIWTINADGTNPTRLTTSPGFHGQPRFAPDGSAIAFIAPDEAGTRQLWLMDLTGNNPRRLTSSLFQVSDPSWAPDSQKLIFVGCSGACNLFTINRAGTGFTQVTSGQFDDWDPDWGSPGIAFSSNRGGTLGLWKIQSDGSGLTQLTSPTGVGHFEPRWDRLTGSLFFVQAESNNLNVWVKNQDGSQTQVTKIGLDTTPPELTCSVTPSVLWPANHQLVPVTATVQITDALSGPAGITLKSITSSEPDNGLGDGDIPGDMQNFTVGTASFSGSLRAERSGRGNGRTYTLIYEGSDKAGNTNTCVTTVIVPHDMGNR